MVNTTKNIIEIVALFSSNADNFVNHIVLICFRNRFKFLNFSKIFEIK